MSALKKIHHVVSSIPWFFWGFLLNLAPNPNLTARSKWSRVISYLTHPPSRRLHMNHAQKIWQSTIIPPDIADAYNHLTIGFMRRCVNAMYGKHRRRNAFIIAFIIGILCTTGYFVKNGIQVTLVSQYMGSETWQANVRIFGFIPLTIEKQVYIMRYERSEGALLLANHGETSPEGYIMYTGRLMGEYGRGILLDAYGNREYKAMLDANDRYIIHMYENVWLPGAKGKNASGVYFNITKDDHPLMPGEEYKGPWNWCNAMRYYWWVAPEIDLKGLCDPEVSQFAFGGQESLENFLERSTIIQTGYQVAGFELLVWDDIVYENADYVAFFPNLPRGARLIQTLNCENSPLPGLFVIPDDSENQYMREILYPENVIVGSLTKWGSFASNGVGKYAYLAVIPFDARLRESSKFYELTPTLTYFQIKQSPLLCPPQLNN